MPIYNFPDGAQPRLMASLLLFALVVTCAPTARTTSQLVTPQSVPVYEEARHHLVYENSVVRVLDVRIPAGDTTAYHVHTSPLVGVAIKEARSWSQVLGEPRSSIEEPSPVPSSFDNLDRTLPYTHRVGNADSVPIHYVIGEWHGLSGLSQRFETIPFPEVDPDFLAFVELESRSREGPDEGRCRGIFFLFSPKPSQISASYRAPPSPPSRKATGCP